MGYGNVYVIGPLLGGLSTFLYVTIILKTNITFKEARALSFLFEPNYTNKWYPLTHIKNLPREQRRTELFTCAQKLMPGTIVGAEKLDKGTEHLLCMLSKMAKADSVVSKEEVQMISNFVINVCVFRNLYPPIPVSRPHLSERSDAGFIQVP